MCNFITLTTLINCCENQPEEAYNLYKELLLKTTNKHEAKYDISKVTYSSLLTIFGRAKDVKHLVLIWKDIEEKNVEPSQIMWSSFLNGLTNCGYWEKCVDIYETRLKITKPE
eukprot:UN28918